MNPEVVKFDTRFDMCVVLLQKEKRVLLYIVLHAIIVATCCILQESFRSGGDDDDGFCNILTKSQSRHVELDDLAICRALAKIAKISVSLK